MGWASWALIAILSLGSGALAPGAAGTSDPLEGNPTAHGASSAASAHIQDSIAAEQLTGVVSIASLSSHNLATRDDGTVWQWRTYHQTAADGNPMTHSPATPITGVHDVVAVARGDTHSLALREDGTVWAWGENFAGQLGDGTRQRQLDPTPVVGLRNVSAVAAGGAHSLALGFDGVVSFWGQGTVSVVSADPLGAQTSPTIVHGLPPIVAIAAKNRYSLAVDNVGGVWTWDHGSLDGEGDWSPDIARPARVAGLTDVVAVAAGTWWHLAIKADGMVWSWAPYVNEAPAPIADLTDVIAVAVGEHHQSALTADGTVWSWGPMTSCRTTATVTVSRPVRVMEPNGAVGLASGHCYTLAFDRQGAISSLFATGLIAPQAEHHPDAAEAEERLLPRGQQRVVVH